MSGLSTQAEALDVSRETRERLEAFSGILKKWNTRINLVSRDSLTDFWARHVQDSLQVLRMAPEATTWVDLGTGGGFPGLVVAIAATELPQPLNMTLVESDQRKAAFLRQAARSVGVPVTVLPERVEDVPPQDADTVSARALADLPKLLTWASRHVASDGQMLFPKGRSWRKEVAEARRDWQFCVEAVPSQTDPEAVILRINGVSRGRSFAS